LVLTGSALPLGVECLHVADFTPVPTDSADS
jgi:hypothetical protein